MTLSLVLFAFLAASPAPATKPATPPAAKPAPAAAAPAATPTSTAPPLPSPPAAKPARSTPSRQKIAVMDFKAVQGVSAGTVEILGNVIAADIARQGFDVIAKSDIQSMLGFQKDRQLLGCTDDAGCIAEIGGSLGVDYVLTGQIGQIGTQFNLSMVVVETRKAKVVSRLSSFCEANEDALVKNARASVGSTISAIRGGAPPVGTAPAAPFTRSRTTAWMAWGASALFLAGGATVGVIAKGKYDDLKAQEGDPNYDAIYADENPSIKRLNTTADVLFVSSAVMAGLGTWVWFRSEPQVALVPSLLPGGAGLAVAGTF